MGFWKNPFKGRQPGNPFKLHPKSQEALDILRASPQTSDDDLAKALHLTPSAADPFIQRARHQLQKEALLAGPGSVPSTNGSPSIGTPTAIPTGQSDMLKLVNYTPDQLVQHVDQRIARIQFGWTFSTKWMEGYSEIWSWLGPIILVVGTIGEVFIVLWTRQKTQELISGLSIVAVAFVLEGTFLAVSYKAATIRNRAERRPDGLTPLDQRKMKRQLAFWIALALGVCVTQIIFIVAQTKDDGIGTYGVWTFAFFRAVFTLVADGYTAFAHEEKPTTADQALQEEEQRTRAGDQLLAQKQKEITIINAGILAVREASVDAQIKDNKMKTRLELEKMQNQAQIDALRTQQETAQMTIQMLTRLQRAILDPAMPADQRQMAISVMVAMGQGYSQLEPAKKGNTTITEEDDS